MYSTVFSTALFAILAAASPFPSEPTATAASTGTAPPKCEITASIAWPGFCLEAVPSATGTSTIDCGGCDVKTIVADYPWNAKFACSSLQISTSLS
ncbi:hypothetical protein K470DRAFT_255155, partial [Piedraia hortae CBS 480.64]